MLDERSRRLEARWAARMAMAALAAVEAQAAREIGGAAAKVGALTSPGAPQPCGPANGYDSFLNPRPFFGRTLLEQLQPSALNLVMAPTDTLYVSTRADWRDWLAAHHATASEVWLVSYRVHTGRPSLPYDAAVEEALCVGWIDSVRRGLDADRTAQRFTPRRPGSPYSQTNKERLARLGDQGRLLPAVETDLIANRPEAFQVPDDVRAALQRAGAWAFFTSMPPAYQRIRAAYVDHARRDPEAFEKRLAHLVERSAKGRPFGYGIESFYSLPTRATPLVRNDL